MVKFVKIILVLFSTLCLSGCAIIGFDAQDLITPPTSNEDQQAIYELLKEVDDELNFIYPTSGDYRSAVILEDLNNDGINEAMGFVQAPEGGIVLQFMTEIDGEWQTVSSFSNSGMQVDRVLFGDFTGDGENEIIVGWGSTLSITATISIFKFETDGVEEYSLENTYNEMILTDFDNDGIYELFTSTLFISSEEDEGSDMQAVGRVYRFNEDAGPYIDYSTILKASIIKYTSIYFTDIYTFSPCVVLEGVSAEGNTVTQILRISNNRLTSMLENDAYSELNNFIRPSSLSLGICDINGDNIVEFPLVSSGNSFNIDGYVDYLHYYVDWVRFYDGGYRITNSYIINTTDNFMFEYDSQYEITCEYTSDGTYTIKKYTRDDDGTIISSKIIFLIKIYDEETWDSIYKILYTELFTTSAGNVYSAVVYDDDYQDIIESIVPITP